MCPPRCRPVLTQPRAAVGGGAIPDPLPSFLAGRALFPVFYVWAKVGLLEGRENGLPAVRKWALIQIRAWSRMGLLMVFS